MSDLNRRDLFRNGLAGLASGSLVGPFSPLRAMSQAANLGLGSGTGKLLTVFFRGAMDGVSACIPAGDTSYATMRQKPGSSVFVDPSTGLPLFNSSFAVMNPIMQALDAPDAAGNIAWMHQVGNPEGLRSHFTEMQIVETGDPQPEHELNDEGFVARLADTNGFAPGSNLPACSNSVQMQRLFNTTDVDKMLVNIRDLTALAGTGLPQALTDHLNSVNPTTAAEQLVAGSGTQLLNAQGEIQAANPPFDHSTTHLYFPRTNAEAAAVGLPPSPAGLAFMAHLEEAVYLLRYTSCRFAGVELGGFDTHQNQTPQLNTLLAYVAHGLRSFYDLTLADPATITALCMTEFGRTAAVNGNSGTDHGVGALYMAIGRAVKGGVYNAHAAGGTGPGAPWTNLDQLPGINSGDPFANACYVRTNFLAVFQEILEDVFGITNQATQNLILPGLIGATGPQMRQLDFL